MTDFELRQHVQQALEWEPSVDASDIGVAVDDGVVTLRGNVKSYAERHNAESAVLRVYGVKALANDLVVKLTTANERTDTEIAHDAALALQLDCVVPHDRVTATVTNGWVTLTGTVDAYYQSAAAERAIRNLAGVKGVLNNVTIHVPVSAENIREKIEAALRRSAEVDASHITVATHDGTVTLGGRVRSWAERLEAERAAWAAPGVRHVEDRIAVAP
jgi:osmotically-inducible protein OsmY